MVYLRSSSSSSSTSSSSYLQSCNHCLQLHLCHLVTADTIIYFRRSIVTNRHTLSHKGGRGRRRTNHHHLLRGKIIVIFGIMGLEIRGGGRPTWTRRKMFFRGDVVFVVVLWRHWHTHTHSCSILLLVMFGMGWWCLFACWCHDICGVRASRIHTCDGPRRRGNSAVIIIHGLGHGCACVPMFQWLLLLLLLLFQGSCRSIFIQRNACFQFLDTDLTQITITTGTVEFCLQIRDTSICCEFWGSNVGYLSTHFQNFFLITKDTFLKVYLMCFVGIKNHGFVSLKFGIQGRCEGEMVCGVWCGVVRWE